jgi:hypothetical protein
MTLGTEFFSPRLGARSSRVVLTECLCSAGCLPVASGVVHMVVARLACGALEKPLEKWGLLRSS